MSSRVLPLAASVLLLLPAAAAAQQPDPEVKTPYLWRVVVQAKPHPLLTSALRDGLRRDVLAALQPALGVLGTVEVIDLAEVPRDKWDPLWQQFDDKGFAALDAPRDLTGVKTHFLRLEVRDGAFHLESRQHDGFTGLASPGVRRQSTRSPELVGRLAGIMLDRDFGLAGTAEPIADKDKPNEALVRIRGGQLGPLERFVKVGDVFAVSQLQRTNRPAPPPARTATGKVIAPPPGSVPPEGFTAAARDFTLLRVLEPPKEGAVRCKVLTRYVAGLPAAPRVAGYRCMKLATVEAPLSVRLVGGDGRAHEKASVVNVRASGDFDAKADARDNLDFRDGLFRSSHPLPGVACVVIAVGPGKAERFPLPVLGGEPVTLRFELDPKAEERAVFERACLALAGQAADARLAQAACFEAVAKLIAARNNTDALARAKSGHKTATEADRQISDELPRLKEQLSKSPNAGRLLDSVADQLARLRQGNEQLAGSVRQLEGTLAKEKNPAVAAQQVQAEGLNTRIGLLLARGDIDEALAAYDQLVALRPDDADVKARRDKLKSEWQPKGAEHEKARAYLLRTWPALGTVQDFKDSLPALRNAVEACKKAGDKHAFRKLQTVFSGFAVKLGELVAPLDGNSDADRKALEDAKTVREVVAKIEQEVAEYLKANP